MARTISEAFNLADLAHQVLVPDLMREIDQQVATFAECGLSEHFGQFGPIPYKALENDAHLHQGRVFDLYIDGYGAEAADRSLSRLEWAIVDSCQAATGISQSEQDDIVRAVARLAPLAAPYCRAAGQTETALARTWLGDQIGSLVEYSCHIRMVTHGTVAAFLKESRVPLVAEPGRNLVRIVIDDDYVAEQVSRAFR